MKNTKGIAILLFAILLQLCSFGMELLTLVVGIVGLIISIIMEILLFSLARVEKIVFKLYGQIKWNLILELEKFFVLKEMISCTFLNGTRIQTIEKRLI